MASTPSASHSGASASLQPPGQQRALQRLGMRASPSPGPPMSSSAIPVTTVRGTMATPRGWRGRRRARGGRDRHRDVVEVAPSVSTSRRSTSSKRVSAPWTLRRVIADSTSDPGDPEVQRLAAAQLGLLRQLGEVPSRTPRRRPSAGPPQLRWISRIGGSGPAAVTAPARRGRHDGDENRRWASRSSGASSNVT